MVLTHVPTVAHFVAPLFRGLGFNIYGLERAIIKLVNNRY